MEVWTAFQLLVTSLTVSAVTGKQEEMQLGPDTHAFHCPSQQSPERDEIQIC